MSLLERFSYMAIRVRMAFLANWDLRESTSLTSSLMIGPCMWLEVLSSYLWNIATLFRLLQASNCLAHSPLDKWSKHCLYCKSGFGRGSATAL